MTDMCPQCHERAGIADGGCIKCGHEMTDIPTQLREENEKWLEIVEKQRHQIEQLKAENKEASRLLKGVIERENDVAWGRTIKVMKFLERFQS